MGAADGCPMDDAAMAGVAHLCRQPHGGDMRPRLFHEESDDHKPLFRCLSDAYEVDYGVDNGDSIAAEA